MRIIGLGLLFCTAFLHVGCSFLLPSNQITTQVGKCAPKMAAFFPVSNQPPAAQTPFSFSSRAIEVAAVMDSVPILARWEDIEVSGGSSSIPLLEVRQLLTERLLLTLFEVSSAVAEIVCERDRADQVADRMEEIDTGRIKQLTLISILISGVTAVVSGGIGLAGGASMAADAAEVSGGVLSSSFGGFALFAGSKQEFQHGRNVLKEVWDNPKFSALFSPTLWRFLQRQGGDGTAAREDVIKAWRQQGRLGEQGSSQEQERIALFFGPGGLYSAPDLRARASMLETLQAQIQLLAEELEFFLRELQTRMWRVPQKG